MRDLIFRTDLISLGRSSKVWYEDCDARKSKLANMRKELKTIHIPIKTKTTQENILAVV